MGVKNINDSFKATEEIVKSLKACPVFDDLPEELLSRIAPLTEWIQIKKGSNLLKQGAKNSKLFFLMKGKMAVSVDSEEVSVLQRSGDVIGEMSIISDKPCSASINAISDCELFAIEAKDFANLSSKDAQAFQHTLYRVFALILTDKLSQTNQKARDFEIANRDLIIAHEALEESNRTLEEKVIQRTADLKTKTDELLKSHLAIEQRNTELLANQKKLEEANAIKNATVEKLDGFVKQELAKLEKTITSAKQGTDENFKNAMVSLNSEITKLRSFVHPLKVAYDSEVNMASKRVLLLEPKTKEQIVAKMALGGTGVELDIATDLEAGRDLIKANHYDIVFTGTDLISLISDVQKKNPDAKIVFLTSDDIPTYLHYLEDYPNLSNVVSFNSDDRVFTIKNITTTVSKLVNRDLFGLEKYIGWGADVSEVPIRSSIERRGVVDEMEKKFLKFGIRKSVVQRVKTVAEELLMNAIYDAPVDKNGKPTYNHLHRTVKITLKEHETGLLRYASDGLLVAISVTDPFGALNRNTIVKYLRNCYGDKPGTLHDSTAFKGGAGLGLFQLIATSDLVVFNVYPGRKTEVIALFNTDPKLARIHKKPSFHFFYK